MEIKEYVLKGNQLAKLREKPKTGRKKKTEESTFRVLAQSGCDFVIEKTRGSRKWELVIMVSRAQFYIKSGDKIMPLTESSFQRFLSGLKDEILLDEVSWLTALDQKMCSRVWYAIQDAVSRKLMKKGVM